MQFSAQELAAILGADLEGNPDVKVSQPGKIEEGGPGTITFLANPRYEPFIYTTTASVVVVDRDFLAKGPVLATLLRVDKVYESFSRLLAFYDQAVQARPQGISPHAVIDATAHLADSVAVGRFSTIERGAQIGDNVVIFDHVYIGAQVRIGAGTVVFPGVRIMHQCEIGEHCRRNPNSGPKRYRQRN
jgi:UDP-3-O-[3-hydroxymyristoyl] glucosamine N-acyltransferase